MALRVYYPQGLPTGFYSVDPTAKFLPGMIGALTVVGTEVCVTVCDGASLPPYGVLDDIKAMAFFQPSAQEVIVVLDGGDDGQGHTKIKGTGFLAHANIIEKSFASDVIVTLVPTNGVIIVPAGTPLNFDSDDDGILDSVKVTVSYIFEVSDIPADDTTMASGRVTVWTTRMEAATDQYDTSAAYAVNSYLYCGTGDMKGKFTSEAPLNAAAVALCTGPPSSLDSFLNFMWF